MKLSKALLTGLLAASLTSLNATAGTDGEAPGETKFHGHGGLLDRLQTAIETDDSKFATEDDLAKELSQIGGLDYPDLRSLVIPNLEKKFTCESGGAVAYKTGTEVDVTEIAKAICKSYELLKTSINLDAEAQKRKLAIQRSNAIYAKGLVPVLSKIDDDYLTTPKAQAIVRLLSLGQLNASGVTPIEVIDNSSKLLESLTNALHSKLGKSGTAESLLDSSIIEAWPNMNTDDREKLVRDLIGCAPVKH